MSRATVTVTMKRIFDEFKPKIQDLAYYPKTPIETLKSRMTAVWCLESDDSDLSIAAAAFIKRTSTTKEEDLQRLKNLAATIKAWQNFEICSVYENGLGPYVEYKISLTTTKGEEQIHQHALYKEESGNCCYISQTPPLVRVIGDPILHSPGNLFPATPTAEQLTELHRQVEVAKDILVTTSGAGIAANQCMAIEFPYRFAIVGIFKDIPAHVEGVKRRYPDAIFPEARIMVNPKIISYSETMQTFKHACLSVPSPNRCEVQSPTKITIAYLDPTQAMARVEVTLEGMDAVVLWHEMNHILDGKTYIDTALASLTPTDLTKFEDMVVTELHRRDKDSTIPKLTVPPFYFTIIINAHGEAQLDEVKLTEVLPKFTTETLIGFVRQCNVLKLEKNNC